MNRINRGHVQSRMSRRAGLKSLLRAAAWRVWTVTCTVTLTLSLSLHAAAATTVVDDRGRQIELAAPPQRIVSLLPSLTETVCALQYCERLVGTDRFSDWPASAKSLPKLGGLEDTQIERIVALKPDVVLAAMSARAIERLEGLGLKVITLEPKSLQDTRRVIGVLAQALGDDAAGHALWHRIDSRIRAAAARVPAALRGQRVYFEVASAPYAAGEASFIGELLQQLGMGNVVPAALGPFPKLNPEFVVRAQPDIVMASARTLAEMPGRPGWRSLRALRERRQCGFETERWDLLVRPGPRMADAAEVLADCLVALGARNAPSAGSSPARSPAPAAGSSAALSATPARPPSPAPAAPPFPVPARAPAR